MYSNVFLRTIIFYNFARKGRISRQLILWDTFECDITGEPKKIKKEKDKVRTESIRVLFLLKTAKVHECYTLRPR